MSIGPRAGCRRPSRGFTIVEVVVAMTLLVTGALAVVGTTAAAIRSVAGAEAELAAMSVAQSRLETLAALGCSGPLTGSEADPSTGVRERWKIDVSRNGVHLATDSVEYLEHGLPRLIVRRRLIVC